jgi:hypothetical protein
MPRPGRAPLCAVLAACAVAVGATLARAGDAPPPGPAPRPVDDSLTLGARYFDHAIAWVARGGSLGRAVNVYVHAEVKWDMEDNRTEGEQSVWFVMPDKMRSEITLRRQTTTKLLSGSKAWVVSPSGKVSRIHATPEAETTLKQMKEDLLRLQDLAAFVTLEGLKGPGVVFQYQGATEGRGVFEGRWLKVARRSPDGRKMTFWLGYEAGPDGTVRATYPGVVEVEGDAAQRLWTEDWILSDWDSASATRRPYRYPARIQAWRRNADPGAKAEEPHRFLLAAVDDIQVNTDIPASKFEPPETPGER